MSEATLGRVRAAIVAIAPLLLLIGFIYLPYVSDFTDEAKVAEAVGDNTARWAWAAIILTVALGLMQAAAVIVRMHLAEAGEHRWSQISVLLLLVGGALFLASSADLGYVYVEGSGQDIAAYTEASTDWVGLRLVASVIFGLGFLSLAMAVYKSGDLPKQHTWAVVIGLVVLTTMLFVPMGWALYVAGVAAIVGMWPLAYHLWAPAGEGMMMARPASA
jgi:hypothetical protein